MKPTRRVVLRKLNVVEMKIDARNASGNTPVNEVTATFSSPDKDLEIFPVTSTLELDNVEIKLAVPAFFNKLSGAAVYLGKSFSTRMTVTNIMNHLMTYNVGKLYTMKGKGKDEKPAFENKKLNALVHSILCLMICDVFHGLQSDNLSISSFAYVFEGVFVIDTIVIFAAHINEVE
ncbi:uncharacterized protein LOC122510110 isoform X2 [Leptopilina heterotoma]|uniref:uncharacterized protein LOC122510110 isoform X2 n=1 Tax=Leptopilina heterotoma TaxID=63436 RepID=UPI001CA8AA7C|nr:uncharacterized protein LOC122510110 isoform X2 [Leptopilina heterotoma]